MPPAPVTLFGREVFVWGAGWGVGGAAFASGLSTAIVACLFLVVLLRKKSPIQISLKQRYPFGAPLPADGLGGWGFPPRWRGLPCAWRKSSSPP